ncbi:hypothetical protein PPYR_15456 [Photinus pyralis]|uniref:Uncharacterized protein n=1 Tax=Photinus pyralis TaxID=7054 RepID=A0A5N3ZYS7_PHOPY|nr:hypothetical protein PPYR_15456 [Photinus pyralis]
MPLNQRELINVVVKLAEHKNLRVTIKESAKAGAIAGGSALIGGLLGGPIGIAIGGTIGSVFAAATAKEFKSVAAIILEDMTPRQRQQFVSTIRRALQQYSWMDVYELQRILRENQSVEILLLAAISNFFKDVMGHTISMG